jgi:hypothetical protein
MPHYIVILHALHNYLSFSFTISFTVNNHKTINEIHCNFYNNIFYSSLTINNIYIPSLSSTSVSLSIFYSKGSLQICKVYRFNKFYKNLQIITTSVSLLVGQLPPLFFICFIIPYLWLRNFLHWNIKWSAVSSSSSHGHIALSVSPNLYRCDLIFPCPVSIVVKSGNTGERGTSYSFTKFWIEFEWKWNKAKIRVWRHEKAQELGNRGEFWNS